MKMVVVGAGMMGRGAVFDLLKQPDVDRVVLVDGEATRLERLAEEFRSSKLAQLRADLSDPAGLLSVKEAAGGASGLVSCVPYRFNLDLAGIAVESRCHFTDLGGNNDVVDAQFEMDARAKGAGVAIVPDCGLAPGTVNVLAGYAHSLLDETDSIRLRVGGLPKSPKPPMDYHLVFSANGLINEYVEPARVIRGGRVLVIPSLTELETLEFPAPFGTMEAFVTSGGSSTLTASMEGRVRDLDYKTVRYPGHCRVVQSWRALGLTDSEPVQVGGSSVSPRALLETCMEAHLSEDAPDVVLLRCDASGTRKGLAAGVRIELVDEYDTASRMTSMARTTAFAETAIMLMLCRGQIQSRGVMRQELAVPGETFIREMAARGVRYAVQTSGDGFGPRSE